MDLDLEVMRTFGRAPIPLEFEVGESLTLEDLGLLDSERGVQKPLPSVKRLSERHRNLARMLSLGVSDGEAAAATGYTVSRISILKGDPAFKNLMHLYGERHDIQIQELGDKMLAVNHMSIDTLMDRLEEKPDEIPVSTLLEISKVMMDRLGHGPQTTNVNVQVNIADRLEAARKRVMARVITADVVEIENDEGLSLHERSA